MLAGRLRRRITLQRATETRDSYGDPVVTWSDLGTVWASLDESIGKELFDRVIERSERPTEFRIRYFAGLTPKDRIVFGARTFDIVALVNVDDRSREWQIMAVENAG